MFWQPEPVEEDEQAGIPVKLYKCTDGAMRTAYERAAFEKRVRWTWLGWTLAPEKPRQPTTEDTCR
jgi:hypothetical protein